MRTYWNISGSWVEVDTDANGFDDAVWLATLTQVLKLSPGESPFFADYGIPAQQSVITQVFPDYYVTQTQAQFAPRFASLIVTKLPGREPAYRINVIANQGAIIPRLPRQFVLALENGGLFLLENGNLLELQ